MTPKGKDTVRDNRSLVKKNKRQYPLTKKTEALPLEDDYINNLNDSKDITPLNSLGQDNVETKRDQFSKEKEFNKLN